MEDMKTILKDTVSQRLAAAPGSTAKAELIEELTDNLFCRYNDLLSAGMTAEEARAKAVDALGDTDELVEYLKGLEPDQPLPQLILDPEKEDDGRLDDVLKNVEEIVKGAMKKAKTTFDDVKQQLKDSGAWTSKNGKMEIHVNGQKVTDPEAAREISEELDAEFDELDKEFDEMDKEFAAEEEADASLKDMVDDMMKDIKNVLRQSKDIAREATHFAAGAIRDAADEFKRDAANPAGTALDVTSPVEGDKLRGIDVELVGGEVNITMNQDPDGDVLVGGDIEDFEVFRSEDGVLTIRPIKTETTSFFSGRGIFSVGSITVELELPCRDWDFLKIATTSADISLAGNSTVKALTLTAVSGDVDVDLAHCEKAVCRTTSGDVNWDGSCGDLQVQSISGDVEFRGSAATLFCRTTSGDVTAEGSLNSVTAKTIGGDLCVRTNIMPEKLDVNTTSGDMWVDIPDGTAFTAAFRSTSGDFSSDFFTGSMSGRNCRFTYLGGGDRTYNFSTISGDLELRKFR